MLVASHMTSGGSGRKADELLTATDAAAELGCHPNLIRWYAKTGALPALRARNGHRFFFLSDVKALGQQRKQRFAQRAEARAAKVKASK